MKMFEYIRVNTLGVSQDAQRRAFTLIRTIIDGYKKQEQEIKQHVNHHGEEEKEEEEEEDHLRHDCSSTQVGSVNAERIGFADIERVPTGSSDAPPRMPFFHYIQALLEERWRRIVSVLEGNSLFTLPVYDEAFCTFLGKAFRPNPGMYYNLICYKHLSILSPIVEGKLVYRILTLLNYDKHYTTSNFTSAMYETQQLLNNGKKLYHI